MMDAKARRHNYRTAIPLPWARLCLDCCAVHMAEACPVCASRQWHYLARWLDEQRRRGEKETA